MKFFSTTPIKVHIIQASLTPYKLANFKRAPSNQLQVCALNGEKAVHVNCHKILNVRVYRADQKTGTVRGQSSCDVPRVCNSQLYRRLTLVLVSAHFSSSTHCVVCIRWLYKQNVSGTVRA